MPTTLADTLEGWERMASPEVADVTDGIPPWAPGLVGVEPWSGLEARRRRLTTPVWLRLASVALGLCIVALGGVTVSSAISRRNAAEAVGRQASSVLIRAEDLYVALADADAAASSALLTAGLEPPALRARYVRDLGTAGQQLAAIAGEPSVAAAARPAIAAMSSALPTYAGLVESARTNSRHEFPLGATYLRRASDLMRGTILPAATSLYMEASQQLYQSYRSGASPSHAQTILIVGGLALAALLAVQALVAWRTRRVLNVGLAVATAVVAGLALWALRSFEVQETALARSEERGSDPLIVLSTIRILGLRSLSDENLQLIERGTEPAHLKDFAAVTTSIGAPDGSSGLLAKALRLTSGSASGPGTQEVVRRYQAYLAVHDRVRQLDDAAAYGKAVDLAVGEEALAAAALDDALANEIGAARQRLEASAREAQDALAPLVAVIALLSLAAVALVVFGLQGRIREYR